MSARIQSYDTCTRGVHDANSPDSTNPFISKTPASPHKGAITESTDGLTGLKDGSGRMDIASRSNSDDLSFAKDKDGSKDGTKGRDVSSS